MKIGHYIKLIVLLDLIFLFLLALPWYCDGVSEDCAGGPGAAAIMWIVLSGWIALWGGEIFSGFTSIIVVGWPSMLCMGTVYWCLAGLPRLGRRCLIILTAITLLAAADSFIFDDLWEGWHPMYGHWLGYAVAASHVALAWAREGNKNVIRLREDGLI